MTSDQERPRDDDGIEPRERTDGPQHKPTGELGGDPINADETAPGESVPRPATGADTPARHPEAVEGEPGSDL